MVNEACVEATSQLSVGIDVTIFLTHDGDHGFLLGATNELGSVGARFHVTTLPPIQAGRALVQRSLEGRFRTKRATI